MAIPTPTSPAQPIADLEHAVADIAQPPAGSEQRNHLRKMFRSAAQIRTPNGELLQVHTLDISVGGLSVVASVNPKPNTTYIVYFNIPIKPFGRITAEAQAMVVHSIFSSSESGFRIGLQFNKLSPEAYAAITQFVNA